MSRNRGSEKPATHEGLDGNSAMRSGCTSPFIEVQIPKIRHIISNAFNDVLHKLSAVL